MIKSLVGALVGAVTLGILLPGAGLVFEWLGFGSQLLVAVLVCATVGAIIGWLRPGIFLNTVLFFIEPDLFD